MLAFTKNSMVVTSILAHDDFSLYTIISKEICPCVSLRGLEIWESDINRGIHQNTLQPLGQPLRFNPVRPRGGGGGAQRPG